MKFTIYNLLFMPPEINILLIKLYYGFFLHIGAFKNYNTERA